MLSRPDLLKTAWRYASCLAGMVLKPMLFREERLHTAPRPREMAMDKGIHYACVGNVPHQPGNRTYCPRCRKVVMKRNGFFVEEIRLKNGRCLFCGEKIAGVWT